VRAPTDHTGLGRYAVYRPWVETGFWAAGFAIEAVFNTLVTSMDARRMGRSWASWEPITWEVTSNLVLLALVPAVIALVRRYPLALAAPRNLAIHAAATVAYSLVHVLSMIALREAIYFALGSRYRFGGWTTLLFYEYLKDVRTYVLIVSIISVYRFVLLRLQGEASLLDAPDEGPPVEPVEQPRRFLVRKLRKEFLIAADEIEWVQAQGNYVALRVRGHEYLLRTTLGAFAGRLDAKRFVRVHRSYIVNLERLRAIEPLDSGDARLLLDDGSRIPCSRAYRGALRARAS
jgi:hypothetical protein